MDVGGRLKWCLEGVQSHRHKLLGMPNITTIKIGNKDYEIQL